MRWEYASTYVKLDKRVRSTQLDAGDVGKLTRDWGYHGWEAIGFVPTGSVGVSILMKRPIVDGAPSGSALPPPPPVM